LRGLANRLFPFRHFISLEGVIESKPCCDHFSVFVMANSKHPKTLSFLKRGIFDGLKNFSVAAALRVERLADAMNRTNIL
jgi:hypothetical protein